MYCAHCGNPLPESDIPAEIGAESAVAETEAVTSAEVRIAEINADKEIKLAKIAAGVMDAEREVAVAEAEARADAAESVIETLAPEPPEAAPTVIVNDVEAEPEGSESDLPEADQEHGSDSEHDKPRKHRGSYGNPLFFS